MKKTGFLVIENRALKTPHTGQGSCVVVLRAAMADVCSLLRLEHFKIGAFLSACTGLFALVALRYSLGQSPES